MSIKVCTKCKKSKYLDEFYKHSGQKSGLRPDCKECCKKHNLLHKEEKFKYNKKYYQQHKKEMKAYTERHKERIKKVRKIYCSKNPDIVKNTVLKTVYGITLKQYKDLKSKQNDKCLICNEIKKLHIDHDHLTGKIRGLLCGNCNRGIGLFKDNVKFLENAIYYLKENQSVDSIH